MATYKSTALFGGAITADLPVDYTDVRSEIRQVPDTQEVYLAKSGLTSVIVEITERVEPPEYPCTTDHAALQFHYLDMISSGYATDKPENQIAEESTTWSTADARVKSLGSSTPAYTMLATQKPDADPAGGKLPDFVGILFTLIRLVEQKTDILVAINVPHVAGEYDASAIDHARAKHGALLDEAMQTREHILQSFTIQDWGLFV